MNNVNNTQKPYASERNTAATDKNSEIHSLKMSVRPKAINASLQSSAPIQSRTIVDRTTNKAPTRSSGVFASLQNDVNPRGTPWVRAESVRDLRILSQKGSQEQKLKKIETKEEVKATTNFKDNHTKLSGKINEISQKIDQFNQKIDADKSYFKESRTDLNKLISEVFYFLDDFRKHALEFNDLTQKKLVTPTMNKSHETLTAQKQELFAKSCAMQRHHSDKASSS